MWLSLDQAIFVLCLLTACSCWGLSNELTKTSTLGQSFSKDNLQSWDDWLAKRSRLGGYPWGIDELSRDKFQTWQDWLYKRRFGGPAAGNDFTGFDKSKFQEWKDWASKRSLGQGTPFPGFSDFDKSKFQEWKDWVSKRSLGSGALLPGFNDFDQSKFQEWKDWVSKRSLGSGALLPGFNDFDKSRFQHWNDWVSKRMFNIKPGSIKPSFGTQTGLQNWAEYVKRQNFMPPSSDLGLSGSHHFQSWHDWVKRYGQGQVEDNNSSNRIKKRQLGLNSDRYGTFRRYFTEGLQDWRSTFKGTKRDQTQQKSEQK